jgi:hypothetical protein
MRLEKGSKRWAFVVAVSLGAFFTLLGVVDELPGEEAAMVVIVIVSGSNTGALWLFAHVHNAEFANRPKFWNTSARRDLMPRVRPWQTLICHLQQICPRRVSRKTLLLKHKAGHNPNEESSKGLLLNHELHSAESRKSDCRYCPSLSIQSETILTFSKKTYLNCVLHMLNTHTVIISFLLRRFE